MLNQMEYVSVHWVYYCDWNVFLIESFNIFQLLIKLLFLLFRAGYWAPGIGVPAA